MIADDVDTLRVFQQVVAQTCLHALLDINWLLNLGFDTNIQECEIEGVRETIAELRGLIAQCGHDDWLHDPPFVERP